MATKTVHVDIVGPEFNIWSFGRTQVSTGKGKEGKNGDIVTDNSKYLGYNSNCHCFCLLSKKVNEILATLPIKNVFTQCRFLCMMRY